MSASARRVSTSVWLWGREAAGPWLGQFLGHVTLSQVASCVRDVLCFHSSGPGASGPRPVGRLLLLRRVSPRPEVAGRVAELCVARPRPEAERDRTVTSFVNLYFS